MKALIIGHGNSTIGRGMGPEIDNFGGFVIRFPSTNWQSKEDYGWRTDYIVSTSARRRKIEFDERQPQLGIWLYPKGYSKVEKWELIRNTLPASCPAVVCFDEVVPWLKRYLALQDEVSDAAWLSPAVANAVTDDHKYKHFSVGTGAVIIAAQKIEGVREILLLGCDNLWKGTRKDFGRCNFSKTNPTAHNFKVERLLIDEVSNKYEVDIKPL